MKKQCYLGFVLILPCFCLGDDNGSGEAGAVNLTLDATVFNPCAEPNATERICGAAGKGVFFPANPAAEASWPRVRSRKKLFFCTSFSANARPFLHFTARGVHFDRRCVTRASLPACVCAHAARSQRLEKLSFATPSLLRPVRRAALAGFLSRAYSELGALVNRQVCVCIVEALSAHHKERWVRVLHIAQPAFLSLPRRTVRLTVPPRSTLLPQTNGSLG